VLGDVRAHLVEKALIEPPRPDDVLHPSDISADGWCPRAAYHQLNHPTREVLNFRQRNMFAYGHAAHDRFQGWLAEMGELEGMWKCLVCNYKWYGRGVQVCDVCKSNVVQYKELPLELPSHLISGHSDGFLYRKSTILEIKTVGEGTVRHASPALVRAHTHTLDGSQIVDVNGLWGDIRRPFPAHLRQGMTYLHLARERGLEADQVTFVYESKMNQDTKEYTVEYSIEPIKAMLAGARQVAMAMDGTGPEPICRDGSGSCESCQALGLAA